MDNALSGLTIVEVPGGVATRYCGHLFAAHGATVLQVGPGGDSGVGYGGAGSEAYARWLDAGKLRIRSDLSSTLHRAGKGADLVITGQDPFAVTVMDAVLESVGLSDVIRLGLTWFASEGPYRHWIGSDAVIQAMSAVAYATGAKEGAPILPRGHAPQVIGGATAFVAALASILGRQAGWRGRRIDVNILEANLCLSESGAANVALTGDRTVRRGVNRFTPTFPGGIYEASDGWIGVTALTPPQWRSLCAMIGHPELAKNPAHLVSLQRITDADELDKVLVPAFRTRTKGYWLDEGQRLRIPLAPAPNLKELLDTPHWRGRGSFAPVEGAAGATGPAMPFHAEVLPPAAVQRKSAMAAELPLAGLRVLDLTMGWAGPLAARHLADLGADVVKVESCSHFDWWRGFDGSMEGDPPPYETRPSFLMVNRNKRGITLDLKLDAGKALTRRLAARADLVIENYAPGVLDKLGLGASALTAVKPNLVYVQMGAFGAKGPWSSFRAYGSTVEQASGLPFVNGEAGDPPTMQHVAYGDPIAGIYGAIGGMIALYERNKRKTGAIIDLGQVECLFQLGADAIIAQSVQKEELKREGSRHPSSALRAVAASNVANRWIAVSIETAAQWNALVVILGRIDLAVDAAADLATMKRREADLEQAVMAWASPRSASEAVAVLQTAKVPAGPVYASVDLIDDPQLAHDDFWRRADRRFIGSHVVPHAPYLLDGQRPPLRNPSPTLGEHNAAVLSGDLGLSSKELDSLREQGVIGTRAVLEASSGSAGG
jgi:crotonobetainyl-CoA:carnitine CoA-transferase CaiB-like acyl-CoA transferase